MNQQLTIERSPWQQYTEAPQRQQYHKSEWQQTQVKRYFDIVLGKMLQNEPSSRSDCDVHYLKASHVQWNAIELTDLPTMWASPDEVSALNIRVDDLLVCEGGDVGRCALVSSGLPKNCIFQNALHRVRSKPGGSVRFLRYILMHATNQEWFDVLCNRATIAHFTGDKFNDMWIWLPSLLQQEALANLLDRETSHIDATISAKEHQLSLLAEKRRSLITQAVTRGLNPNVPLRDSGLPWIGKVPAHWTVERTRWLFQERDQRSETGDEELLTVSHITGVTPRSEKDVNMFEAETTEGYKKCRQGDLVINTMWAWMGAMGTSPVDGIVSPAYNVYTPGKLLESGYVDALVRTPQFIQEATRYSKGVWSSRLRLYPDEFFILSFPVPPLEEQKAIVSHIEDEKKKTDALRQTTERTIALLKERRAALIAAAVTGQLPIGIK